MTNQNINIISVLFKFLAILFDIISRLLNFTIKVMGGILGFLFIMLLLGGNSPFEFFIGASGQFVLLYVGVVCLFYITMKISRYCNFIYQSPDSLSFNLIKKLKLPNFKNKRKLKKIQKLTKSKDGKVIYLHK